MAPKYVIEYRQVNINIGDCSFVLLVEDEQGKDPVIKSSVLIDGGDGGDIRIKNIRRAMRRIEKKYKMDEGQLKLDAMVITHWDHDHYFGLLKLLEEDLDEEAKKSIGSTSLLEVSFLRYKKGDPQSILYIPYPEQVGNYTILYSPPPPAGTGEFGFTTPDGRRTRICKYLADIPLKQDSILKGNPKVLAVSDTSEIIGRDLFTNEKPALAQVVSAADPKALADAHTATMPGLYCVAANNRYLNGKKTSPKLSKKMSTPTNRSSIICIVIRPDGTASHYLAGDADRDLEAKVIDWTGLDQATPGSKPTLQQRIAIVKASHHGSAKSTPITLCQTYKPMFFVFSSGDKHRHPTWETLLYVYSYYVSPIADSISIQDGGRYQIYTTSFPYWIDDTQVPDEELFNDEDPLTRTTRAAKLYRTTISSFFDASTRTLDPVHNFQNDPTQGDMTDKDVEDRAKWIREYVQNVILDKCDFINDPKSTSLPSTSSAANLSKLDSRVSSIFFMSDDDRHVVEVDWIDLNVIALPPVRKRSKTPPPLAGGAPKKKKIP